MNANYTLLDILTNNVFVYKTDTKEHLPIKNGIEIPMIQRDYAQGRTDERTTYIREKFLKDLHSIMRENQNGSDKCLNLDFVYGYIENSTFIPLDGQQRLTTLYIIYWFLAFKDGVSFSENGLHLFSYKTRQSAKEFLERLNKPENIVKIKAELDGNNDKIVDTIKNQHWYNLNWDYDPTVKGFLKTLEEVSILFSDISFDTLIEKRPVNFHFLQINEYGLGDNLYIKMNARGKPLSDFENFKASFENVIANHESAKDFINKIDGVWLDVFWKFTIGSLAKNNVEEDVSKFSKKCDELMHSFIKKITEYLYYKDDTDKNYQFNDINIKSIYSKEENLHFLIQSFDLISKLNYEEWENYFTNIFSEKFQQHRVAIHQSSLNLILKIFNNESFSHFENLLFFGWLSYITRVDSINITSDLKDFLRVVRNYINNINQKNKTSLDTELRTDYYNDILNTIFSLSISNPYKNLNIDSVSFRKEYIQYEIAKYNLFQDDILRKELILRFEDHSTLRGLIFNFDFTPYNNTEIQNIIDNFYSLYNSNIDYKDIIRLLLCYGDYSVKVGYSNLGEFKFFGQEGKWHRVLASPDGEITPNFAELFKIFSKEPITDWDNFIEIKVSENIESYKDSWLWYCLNPKYKTILDHPIYTQNTENRIEIFYNQSLNSYHHNPFVFWFRYHSPQEIRNHINEPDSCAQYSNFSRLHLKNGVELEQINNDWIIYNLDENFNHLSFKFDEEQNRYILNCENLIDDLMPFIEVLNAQKHSLKQEV